MIKIKSYVEHDFILLMDGGYEDTDVRKLAAKIEDEFEVETIVDRDDKPNDWFDNGCYAIKIRTIYPEFDRIRKYMYALGYDDEYGYYSLVKHDQEDFYSVM